MADVSFLKKCQEEVVSVISHTYLGQYLFIPRHWWKGAEECRGQEGLQSHQDLLLTAGFVGLSSSGSKLLNSSKLFIEIRKDF